MFFAKAGWGPFPVKEGFGFGGSVLALLAVKFRFGDFDTLASIVQYYCDKRQVILQA
jgi:hypothetical protein